MNRSLAEQNQGRVAVLEPDQDDMGQLSKYSEETAIAICERHAGGEFLVEICRGEGMPSRAALYRWLGERPEFAALLDLAREEFADKVTREIVEIADSTVKVEDVPLSRLRMDARKIRMQRLLSRSFARRMDAGGIAAPLSVSIHLDPEE